MPTKVKCPKSCKVLDCRHSGAHRWHSVKCKADNPGDISGCPECVPATNGGLISVCCGCMRVRVTTDTWLRTELRGDEPGLAHGICPECTHELYPDIADMVLSAIQNHPSDDTRSPRSDDQG